MKPLKHNGRRVEETRRANVFHSRFQNESPQGERHSGQGILRTHEGIQSPPNHESDEGRTSTRRFATKYRSSGHRRTSTILMVVSTEPVFFSFAYAQEGKLGLIRPTIGRMSNCEIIMENCLRRKSDCTKFRSTLAPTIPPASSLFPAPVSASFRTPAVVVSVLTPSVRLRPRERGVPRPFYVTQ